MATLSMKREKDIYNQNTLLRQERVVHNYAIYFEGKPAFATYYSQNQKTSMVESSLDDTVGLLGQDSPIRYNVINDLPLYALTGIESLSSNVGDFGLNTEIEGTAILIPGLIDPYEEDLFTVTHDTGSHVFKVTKVDRDNITNENFAQITFKLHNVNVNELDNQLDEEFITEYDNIGTNYDAVISKTDHNMILYLVEVHNILLNFLREYLYHDGLNFMYVEEGGVRCYDPMISEFARRNRLYERYELKRANESIYIDKLYMDNATYKNFYSKRYKSTIFHALDTASITNLTNLSFTYMANVGNSELTYESDTYLVTNYSDAGVKTIFDSDLLNRLNTTKTLYDDGTHVIEDMIISYFSEGGITKNNIQGMLDALDSNIDDDLRGFTSINIALYFIKYVHNNLLIK